MADPKHRELTLTREFDAPRETIWEAWADPKILARWWGPNGVTNPTCEFDARPGGTIHIVMVAGPELGEMKGQHWPMHGLVREADAPKRLVFTSTAIEDPDGTPNMENVVTVTFADSDGKTKMSVHIEVTRSTPKAEPALEGMEMGWNQQLDKLVTLMSVNRG